MSGALFWLSGFAFQGALKLIIVDGEWGWAAFLILMSAGCLKSALGQSPIPLEGE